MNHPNVPLSVARPLRRTRSERAESTSELLLRAAKTTADSERMRLLDEVVVLNMCVAEAVANRYRARGISAEDLKQVAYLALIKAARRYDSAAAGQDFLSFAVPTIRGEVRRYFRDHGWMVRPSRRVQELQAAVFAAGEKLAQRLGRAPRPSEIAAHLDEPVEEVIEVLAAAGCFQPVSLDCLIQTGDNNLAGPLGELLGTEEPGWAEVEARVSLQPVVSELCDRDQRILHLRFFRGWTQAEIAHELGVTQMQISRLLSRILRDLRRGLEETGAGQERLDPAQPTAVTSICAIS